MSAQQPDTGVLAASDVDYGIAAGHYLSTHAQSNEEAFARIITLYARPGHVIIDPTYGDGVFWRHVNTASYDTKLTDLARDGVDLRALPYGSEGADMVVLDPPYRYTPSRHVPHEATPGHGEVSGRYNLKATAPKNTRELIALYAAGFAEAHRVLRQGGFLVVKCQNTVEAGRQVWVTDVLAAEAAAAGFAKKDELIVTPRSVPTANWPVQRSLHKVHSAFLLFRKGGQFPFGIPSVQPRKRSRQAAQGMLDLFGGEAA